MMSRYFGAGLILCFAFSTLTDGSHLSGLYQDLFTSPARLPYSVSDSLDITDDVVDFVSLLRNPRTLTDRLEFDPIPTSTCAMLFNNDETKCERALCEIIGLLNITEIPPPNLNNTNIKAIPPWIFTFVDAQPFIPPGLLKGALLWYGDWDSCVSIDAHFPSTWNKSKTIDFEGRYCNLPLYPANASVPVPVNPASPAYTSTINLGVCLPKVCDPKTIESLISLVNGLLKLPIKTSASNIQCQKSERSFDSLAKVSLAVVIIIVVFVIFSTIYDAVTMIFWARAKNAHNDDSLPNGGSDDSPPMTSSVMQSSASGLYGATGNIQRSTTSEYQPLLHNDDKTVTPNKDGYEESIWHKLLISFSFISNGSKILNVADTSHPLAFLHGIRVLSLLWVMLGHHYLFEMVTGDNLLSVGKMFKRFSFQVIINGYFSVDTFFVLSGFLVGYLTFRAIPSVTNKCLFGLTFYVHRYIRLTPVYGLIILIYLGLAPILLVGPTWISGEDVFCKDNWWTNLLYVNNFVNRGEMCIGWSWYLADDMQMFVISPLFIAAFYLYPIAGWLLTILAVLSQMIAVGVMSANKHQGAMALAFASFADMGSKVSNDPAALLHSSAGGGGDKGGGGGMGLPDTYQWPFCRWGPYFLGLALGYVCFRTSFKRVPKFVRTINIPMWIFTFCFASMLVYGFWPVYNGKYSIGMNVQYLYAATGQNLWALCVCWVIFACSHGMGGFITRALSWAPFHIISRLTYTGYLIHPVVFMVFSLSQRRGIHFYDTTQIWLYCGNVVMTFAVAFILSCLLEAPFINLEKILLRRERRPMATVAKTSSSRPHAA